ncbi:hypothetical protein K456DRAFT_59548 [Colletotrichum gloeosporioides 23]|nr:hypothetical protein K456DRAFT_59548 [Colletotrichum gloeosporioides 23]
MSEDRLSETCPTYDKPSPPRSTPRNSEAKLETPPSFLAYVEHAIKIDNRLYERRKERGEKQQNLNSGHPITTRTTLDKVPLTDSTADPWTSV